MLDIIMDTDSYKLSHFKQYPPKTTALRAYFEARTDGEDIRFFGLQYVLKKVFTGRVSALDVEQARDLSEAHGLPFPYEGWMKVVREYDGKIPLRIKAVPEGTVVPSHNVLFTVESTDPELFWMVTWFETILSRVWYPTTVATRSYDLKKFIREALEQTSDNPDAELGFKLHDFGARGATTAEAAGVGGMGHLINFLGTDTIEAILYAQRFYGAKDMPGFSIPASEHSTMTTWGRDGEVDAFRNMLKQFGKPGAIVACVSDSYNIYNAVESLWGEKLRQEVIDSGATLVVRPDSGDPLEMVLYCLDALGERFGYTVNDKGFKVLNHVRVIQGDGVNPDDIKRIIAAFIEEGWAMDNVAFGMGGGLLQKFDRDTHKFAYKVCEVEIEGEWLPVFKDPVGGGKKSKQGMLDLVYRNGNYITVDRRADEVPEASVMQVVYENGDILVDDTFEQIRARA
jgi:nicotinamide phosphoribosyltransferase